MFSVSIRGYSMPVLQFEHPIKDFEMWKAAFDRDPIDRRALGVRRHRVSRPLDDPNYVVGELEFETAAQAHACGDALRKLWASPEAAPALIGTPRVRIIESVEDQEY
jgi:hypothetical protein